MHRVKISIEELKRQLEKYKNSDKKDSETMIDLLRSIDKAEFLFKNYIYDILRNYPEILHRRII